MTDSPRSRFRLPHWGWFLLGTVPLVAGYVGLSVWLPYHREQQVIHKIDPLGEHFDVRPVAPDWLLTLMDKDRIRELKVFNRVHYLDLRGTSFTDAEIVHLRELTHIRFLLLDDTLITDTGLIQLAPLTKLVDLSLVGTSVSDAGIVHFGGFKELRNLFLDGTKVTDASMAHLSRMPSLQYLHVERTAVTEKGIRTLKLVFPDCLIKCGRRLRH